VPLWVSFPLHLLRQYRRRIFILSTVVLALAALSALQLWTVRRHLVQGSDDLHAVAAVIKSPASLRNPAARQSIRATLVMAQLDFARARSELRFSAPVLDHLGWLPILGPRLASASPAADAAFHSTNAAIDLVDGLAPVWPAASPTQGRGGGTHATGTIYQRPLLARLALALQASHSDFVDAQREANAAAAALAHLPSQSGDQTLDKARARLGRDLPLLQQASAWLILAPDLMGARKPARYLFMWQNPRELRATGGFLGESDFITLSNGHISSHFVGRAPPHEISSVLLPLPEAYYTNEAYWILCDSNWSPDFPLSARLERWFYGEDTGRWADGVINFLDTATPDILHAVGPVYLPEYRLWVDAAHVQALAQHYVNGKYWGPLNHGASPDTLRKQFVNATMKAILRRVQALPVERWPDLAAALAHAIARGDIFLYHRSPSAEAAIQAGGADGSILHTAGDYLFVVDDNRSYSKLNPYVHESASYDVRIMPSSWLDAKLTIRYHVDPSPANLQGYGPGYGLFGTKHDYQDFLRVYVPPGAVLRGMSGVEQWAPAPAYGLTQFAGRLLVRAGQSATVTITYRLPPSVLAASDFGSYRLTVQRQSGANLTSLQVRIHGRSGITIEPPGGRPASLFETALALSRQTRLNLALHGVAPLSAAPTVCCVSTTPVGASPCGCPPGRPPPHAATAFSDPYVPYAYLRDPRHPL
jgi:hypothetical protein